MTRENKYQLHSMKFLLFGILVSFLFFWASAQEVDLERASERVFVLLDVSGSMKTRIQDAEDAIAEHLNEKALKTPDLLVSYTEFRASDEAACGVGIKIEPLQPFKSAPEVAALREFWDDYTPLGSALASAIREAKNGPAEIVLVSDWDQTEGCGIDINEVSRLVDPNADITIVPIAIRPSDSSQKLVEKFKRRVVSVEKGELKRGEPKATEGILIRTFKNIRNFFEAWLWFVTFIIVSALAVQFGWKNLKLSIAKESEAREIKSLQSAVMIDNNETAKAALQKKIDKITDQRKQASTNEQPRSKSISNLFGLLSQNKRKSWPLQIKIGILIFFIAFVVAALPAGQNVFWLRAGNIQAGAWKILNSDFAAAFAIIWIVTVFFAAQQYRRRIEVEEEFSIATDEAGYFAMAEEKRELEEAEQLYQFYRECVDEFSFRYPLQKVKFTAEGSDAVDVENFFEEVTRLALEKVLGDSLDKPTSTTDDYEQENTRLNRYKNLRPSKKSLVSFHQFMREFLRDSHIEKSPLWNQLITRSGIPSRDVFVDTMKQILKENSGGLDYEASK